MGMTAVGTPRIVVWSQQVNAGEVVHRSQARGDSQPMAVIAFLSALVLWGLFSFCFLVLVWNWY